jgi:hypothetical protein
VGAYIAGLVVPERVQGVGGHGFLEQVYLPWLVTVGNWPEH